MDGDNSLFWFLSAWVALLSVMGLALLWLWQHRRKDEAASREALLYRIGQLEERLRKQEELQMDLGRELLLHQEQLRQQQLVAKPTPSTPQVTPTTVPVKDAQTREILQRSKSGQSVLQIAREMSLGQGEVQLVLNLEDSLRSERQE